MNRRSLLSALVVLPSTSFAGKYGPPSDDEEPADPAETPRCRPVGDLTTLSKESLLLERKCLSEALLAYDAEISRRKGP